MSVFQSQAWQCSWWRQWGAHKGFRLVEAAEAQCSGLYIDSYLVRGVVPVHCLQFVGTNYRRLSTPRTEYNRLSSGEESQATQARLDATLKHKWSEAVFRDIRVNSVETSQIQLWASHNGWTVRRIHQDKAYSIQTSTSLDDYRARLGSATRLKLFNRRKVLADMGHVALDNFWPNQVDRFFELLNGFHEKRWGSPCFNEKSLNFHKVFLRSVVEDGGEPDLSVMTLDGTPVSVVYNVIFKKCSYNLQSGYVENFHKKIALGMLHLGYCLEQSFADENVVRFDLLAGHGKNTNYKQHLATDEDELVSLMVVRSGLHRAIYGAKDAILRIKQGAVVKQESGNE
ncbi:MAG: GNAT family N-acetyltransferase [Alteromonadaceae bacterium]|nr:GNAT family N-acetyltransferase [Alteromonadaceae bacterium]|tara:strand:+ start:6970 stop:7995 length:1026 start_codon:yes stop_codon:yes gene_type:complete